MNHATTLVDKQQKGNVTVTDEEDVTDDEDARWLQN